MGYFDDLLKKLKRTAASRTNNGLMEKIGSDLSKFGVGGGQGLQRTADALDKFASRKTTLNASTNPANKLLASVAAGTLRDYGQTLERVSTPEGRQLLKTSSQQLFKEKPSLNTLQNPAIVAALSATDLIPGAAPAKKGGTALLKKAPTALKTVKKATSKAPAVVKGIDESVQLVPEVTETFSRLAGKKTPEFIAGAKGAVTKVKQLTKKASKTILENIKPEAELVSDVIPQLPAGVKPKVLTAGKTTVNTGKAAREALARGMDVAVDNPLPRGAEPIAPRVPFNPRDIADVEKAIGLEPTANAAQAIKGSKTGAGPISDVLRAGQEKLSVAVGGLSGSKNPVVRNLGRAAQGFYSKIGKTEDQVRLLSKADSSYPDILASQSQKAIYDTVGGDINALNRVHSVLDPELNKLGITEADLAPNEKEALNMYRVISDYVNDTNFKNGRINEELWLQGKGGNYIKRMYKNIAFDDQWQSLAGTKKPFNLKPFETRVELNDDLRKQAIQDPGYLIARKLRETLADDNMTAVVNELSNDPLLVSPKPLSGYQRVPNQPAYGALADKWVRKDVIDDIAGFSFTNKLAQKAYDALAAFDRSGIRQAHKKLLTVFNPVTSLGNKTSSYTFAMFNGINPLTFGKNQAEASKLIKNNSPLYRRAAQEGLFGNANIVGELTDYAQKLAEGQDPRTQGGISKILTAIQNNYGRTDDIAKMAALKTWLDRGYDWEESIRRTASGFQNYKTAGFFYDIGSKLPILGNPFVKFQADIVRLMKNAVIDHPVRTAGILGAWQLGTMLTSMASGETPEDKETREGRLGAPRIPFTGISLAVQTPWGEVNGSRLLGLQVANRIPETEPFGSQALGDLQQYSPILPPTPENIGSDPTIGPILDVGLDTDFRGKKVSDPSLARTRDAEDSLLTDTEKNINRGNYLRRAYTPPVINSLEDVANAATGKPNFYGKTQSPIQAALRLFPGIKVEQFGPEQAQAARENEIKFAGYDLQGINNKIKENAKALGSGKIDQKTYDKRISELEKQKSKAAQTTTGTASKFQDKDLAKTVIKAQIESGVAVQPEDIKLYYFGDKAPAEKTPKERSDTYGKVSKLLADEDIPEGVKNELVKASGINEEQFVYYQTASQLDEEKSSMIMQQIGSMERNDALSTLLQGRRSVGGKTLVTTNVTDYLYDQGVLSKEQKALLNAVKYDEANDKFYMDRDYKSGGGGGSGSGSSAETQRKKLDTLMQKIVEALQSSKPEKTRSAVASAFSALNKSELQTNKPIRQLTRNTKAAPRRFIRGVIQSNLA